MTRTLFLLVVLVLWGPFSPVAQAQSRLEALISSTEKLLPQQPKAAEDSASLALRLAESSGQASLQRYAQYLLAYAQILAGKEGRGIKTLEQLAPRLEQNGEWNLLIKTYKALSDGYFKKNDKESYQKVQTKLRAVEQQMLVQQKEGELAQLNDVLLTEQELRSGLAREAQSNRLLADSVKRQITLKEAELMQQSLELAQTQAKLATEEASRMATELELGRTRQRTQQWIAGSGLLILLLAGFFLVRHQVVIRKKEVKLERERATRLEQIDHLKDQFLANTSHELRTPLNGIIGLSEGILDQVQQHLKGKEELSLARLEQHLQLVVASGKRLTSLVNDLLDYSRIRHADLVLHPKPTDLSSLVRLVLQVSAPLTQGKDIRLLDEMPANLPAVMADEDRLSQILHNLIGNAIKFSESGSIRLLAQTEKNMLRITVSDQGIGIPEDKLESIFEAFEQADGSISRSYAGTGLGLSITRHLVEQHGGKIWAESKPGKGSQFHFTLPITTEKVAAQETTQLTPYMADPVQASPIPEFEKQPERHPILTNRGSADSIVRIMIVDDEPINHEVLRQHLRTPQIEVHSAMNGMGAIKLIEESGLLFDLILLDVMMPGMSGYEVAQKVRERYLPSELPIIMVTAKNRVSDLVQGLQMGANDYLAKPFTKDEFMARLSTHLNLHRINNATSRFVPTEFIRTLGHNTITEVRLGDYSSREITVFFSDIRDYTTLAEQMSPADNFGLVKAYSGRMGPIILEHHGFVNQYLGDGIMALFQRQPEDALLAAINMQEELRHYNEQRQARGWLPLRVGMGIHTGPLIMGIIGDDQRSDTAVISDTVNTASRLEGLTRYYGANILLSESVFQRLSASQKEQCRSLGLVQVKGRARPMGIYESFAGDPVPMADAKRKDLAAFGRGIDAFLAGRMEEAAEAFRPLALGGDAGASRMLTQAMHYRSAGLPSDWKGVEIMQAK